jgi:alkanesulfonate monooxygenase SsuD/methylene tetrahydromethanopterin reductase-like flavin-dependent oxidoreductase (luciferase family)
VRIGIVLLPQHRWSSEAARWRRAEEYGFDHAWTYDHLAWRSLADEPWFATVPVLAAAAAVTDRIRLGTWVASPNYRHPVPFAKDLMTLDDVSQGRFTLGVGAGGVGVDATVLGGEVLPPRRRVDRLAEFVDMLDRLLTSDATTRRGEYFDAVDARMLPGCLQQPRLPFVVAANGPRAMRVAARHGQGWATTGVEADDGDLWWAGVAELVRRFEDVASEAGRPPSDVDRYLSLDSGGYALESVDAFEDAVGRARVLGFTDVVTHWPRPSGVYAGSEAVLEAAATRLPDLRAG